MTLKIPHTASEFEALFERLGAIGESQDHEGREACALAIHALLFALGRNQRAQFESYLNGLESGLTPAQEEHLRSMGIDPYENDE